MTMKRLALVALVALALGGCASLARLAMPQVARRQNAIGMADVRAKEEVKVRDAARLVRTGTQMVDVEVWLTDVNPQILEMLKKAGFEPSPVAAKVGKIRLGRIRADRIAELEKLACVLTVRPAPAP